jgi:hypothetical protein
MNNIFTLSIAIFFSWAEATGLSVRIFCFLGDGLSGDVFIATMQLSGSTVVLKNVGDAQGENEINCYARTEGLSGVAQVRTL